MINRTRWDKARAAVLAARKACNDFDCELRVRYGETRWAGRAERAKRERLYAALSRACGRIWQLLERSPRDWAHGVPAQWVTERLSYEDAIRPLGETLSVVPEVAYGYTQPIK